MHFAGVVSRHLRALVVVACVALLAFAWRHVDVSALGIALERASLPLVGIAIALNLLARTAARARRTQLVLGGRVSFRDVVELNLAGYAAGSFVPGPAEEAVCCTQLARRHAFSWRELAAYQITDKSIGVISMAFVALGLLPPVLAVVLGAAAIAAIAIVRRALLVPLGWLVVSNLLCIAMIALCLAAVGASLTTAGCVRVLFATSLVTAIPLVPGHVGTFESAFAFAAVEQGVAPSVALAAGVLYHFAQVAPLALSGLPSLYRMSWGARRWNRA